MSDFWQIFRFVIAALLTLAGVFCMISSVLGLYRFRYALTRIHAASLMDTVSIFLMLSGLSVAQRQKWSSSFCFCGLPAPSRRT
mgnify:CR=1 FL=1